MSRSRAGFTLIELIIVIGLIALVGGLVITSVGGILRGLGERPIPEILRMAVREARYQAAFQKDTTFLRYDYDKREFRVESAAGNVIETFPTGYSAEDRIDIRFYQILPERGLRVSGLRANRSELDAPRFRPDRSSTPFEVEVRIGMETTTHRFDPFSDIEIRRDRR